MNQIAYYSRPSVWTCKGPLSPVPIDGASPQLSDVTMRLKGTEHKIVTTLKMKGHGATNKSQQETNNSGLEDGGAGEWEDGVRGAHGGRMRNPSPPPSSPEPLLLIISGSASLPFLGFFIPFPISKKTTVRQTGPPVSPIGPCFKTIEEEKWGKWVHSRWKLERVNTGMIEVLPTHTFKIKRSYWIQLGGGLERLSLGCIWSATRQRQGELFNCADVFKFSLVCPQVWNISATSIDVTGTT